MSLEITAEEVVHAPPAAAAPPLSRGVLWIMAAACGASAANIFYNQPLLDAFSRYFNVTASHAGLVTTAAQVGYGIGLFFFVPLGDLVERRRIVVALTAACAALLLGAAAAPSLAILITFQLFIGITAMSAQLLVPLAVDLTPAEARGKTVGTLMAGLLSGVLLARTVSGFVGDQFGWRATFGVAAAVMFTMAIILRATLPHRPPTLRMTYPRLMHSMIDLLKTQPRLWKSSAISALSFAGFSAFWTALSFLMAERFHRGATEAGLFGIVGLIGAAGAPLAGKLSDRRGSNFTVTLAVIATAIAFGIMWGWVTIAGLIVGVLLMDLGVQSIQVAEQSAVMALVPEARSRVNTLYMVARFMGGAGGSAIGAAAWSSHRWPGVCAACIAMSAMSLAIQGVATAIDARSKNA